MVDYKPFLNIETKNQIHLFNVIQLQCLYFQTGGKSRFICELVKYREKLFETNFDRIILAQHENLSYRRNETYESIRASFPRAELGTL